MFTPSIGVLRRGLLPQVFFVHSIYEISDLGLFGIAQEDPHLCVLSWLESFVAAIGEREIEGPFVLAHFQA